MEVVVFHENYGLDGFSDYCMATEYGVLLLWRCSVVHIKQ